MSDFSSRALPDLAALMPNVPNLAEGIKNRLVENALRFRRGCERDGDTPIFYATDGDRQIDVASISHVGSHLILFIGNDAEGRHVEFLQHYTHVSLQMVAIPKLETAPVRPRIGFNDKYLDEGGGRPIEI